MCFSHFKNMNELPICAVLHPVRTVKDPIRLQQNNQNREKNFCDKEIGNIFKRGQQSGTHFYKLINIRFDGTE